jgi:nitrile hydratase accessory protein
LSPKHGQDLIAAACNIAPQAIFSEPWEARAFAMAVALCEAGQFDWPEFQCGLIEEIGEAEGHGGAVSGGADYYRRWLGALTRLLEAKGIVDAAELAARVAEAGPPPPSQDPRAKNR